MQNEEAAERAPEKSKMEDAIRINGQALIDLPVDLYIPPDALCVFLEAFEGPLDLLLYLIRKHNIDILDIPISEVTRQYIQYIDLMQELKLELAAEYLLMAAMLCEIKSRLLLPRPQSETESEELDPRAELVRRLQQYERFKKAADQLDALPRVDREIDLAHALAPKFEIETVAHPDVSMHELLTSLAEVMHRAKLYSKHHVVREPLSIRERMTLVLAAVNSEKFTPFVSLFTAEEGRMGVVVTLIAVLELIRQSVLELVQAQPYAPIYLKAKG